MEGRPLSVTVPTGERTSITSSERLVVLGGLGLAAASIVPWYKADQFAFDVARTNGWEAPDAMLSQVGTVLGVVVAIAVLLAGSQHSRPQIGALSWGTALTAASAVVLGLIALKFSLNMENTTVGIYLAMLAAVTELYGAYVTRLTEAPPSSTATGATPFPGNPVSPASVSAGAAQPVAQWPEMAYLLSEWLRAGSDPATALVAYRNAFAGDPARQARLVGELRALLDPNRSEAERTAVVTSHAPHLASGGGGAVLGWIAQTLSPAPPTP
jgi:hypothetical protein